MAQLQQLLARLTLLQSLTGIAVFFLLIAPVLDRFVFPEPAPTPELFPAVGQTFHSESEGFTQRIVRREGDRFWTELTMAPKAPGPPPHVHTKFEERFRVERGVASIRLGDRTVQLQPGEEYLVPPGTVHQPFNATNEETVIAGHTDEFALPAQFSVFLSQAYGFFDSQPENRVAPRALLQMSRFSPVYDAWLDRPPVPVQRALFWVVGPIARVLGYRAHYAQYSPDRVAISVTIPGAATGANLDTRATN